MTKKQKIIYGTFLSVVFLVVTTLCAYLPHKWEDDVTYGKCETIAYYYVLDDVQKRYPDAKILDQKEKLLPAINMKQSKLNKEYNSRHGTDYEGTCSEVAVAMYVSSYLCNNNKMENTTENQNAVFNTVMDIAVSNNYYPMMFHPSGTYPKNIKKILRKTLEHYGIKQTVSEKYGSIYDRVKEAADKGHLSIISVPDHTMVTAGYFEVKIETEEETGWFIFKETKTVVKTVKYLAVLNGWDNGTYSERTNSERSKNLTFSFYAEDDIKQNIVLDFLGLSYFSCLLID